MGPCVAGGPGGLQEAWARSRACFCARALVCQPSLPCSGVRPLPLTRAHPTSPAPIAVVGVSLSLCWTCLCVRHPVGGGCAEGLGVDNGAVPSQAGKSVLCDQLGI